MPRLLVSQHAIERYRQRVNATATVTEIVQVLEEARLQPSPPGWATVAEIADGWAVTSHVAFPLIERQDGALLAVSTIKRRRRSKADRRAYREQQREDRWVA